MASLPPVKLGAIIFISYMVMLIVRKPAEKVFVLTAVETAQPKNQFYLDILLSVAAGITAGIYNLFVLGFPLSSIISLLIGCMIAGYFMSLDTALVRERKIILSAISKNSEQTPPKRLYSMTRKFSLAAIGAVLFFSAVLVLVFSSDIAWLIKVGQDPKALAKAQMSIAYEVSFVMIVMLILIVNLIISYSKNLKLLFSNETGVLERVSQGDLTRKVPVATDDEFGVIAGHTNSMIDGLRHRMRMINELKLAEEIQRNLLPKSPPVHPGLDISGTSLYCDEIGGDYYDFFKLPENRIGVAVADASGHGVGAAMHMTSARSFLHFGASEYESPARLLEEINIYLTRDSGTTSWFLSMFFLEVDTKSRALRWVRAGHEPAILFDPVTGQFEELSGEGIALGVLENYGYQEYSRQGWNFGSVLVIGTDGIHETRNESDEMFGQDRLREIIRKNATEPAASIKNAVIDALQMFKGKVPREDDITLVVIKLLS